MLANAVSQSLSQLFSPPFRSVLWKSIGLTVAMLIGIWFVAQTLVTALLLPLIGLETWTATAITWLLGTGLVIGMGFLIAPVTSIFAGVFLDDIAEAVEQKHYPGHRPGTALPLTQSMAIAVRFFGLVLIGNLIALLLVLFLGLGIVIFFVLNGYLLGREYFQFAALRHVDQDEAAAIRDRNGIEIFLAGLLIAVVLAIPVVNLLTPLFAGALMTHVFKGIELKSTQSAI